MHVPLRPYVLSSWLGKEAVVGMVTFPVTLAALKEAFKFPQALSSFPPLQTPGAVTVSF